MSQREQIIDAEVRALFRRDAETYKRDYAKFIAKEVAGNFFMNERRFGASVLDEIGNTALRAIRLREQTQWWD